MLPARQAKPFLQIHGYGDVCLGTSGTGEVSGRNADEMRYGSGRGMVTKLTYSAGLPRCGSALKAIVDLLE